MATDNVDTRDSADPHDNGLIDAVLDAMDGVVYWTDPDGVILGGGVRNWTRFAIENGAPGLQLGAVVGRNLFEQIRGDDIRQVYRQISAAVLRGAEGPVSFGYRCDGPLISRQMRMAISAVQIGKNQRGVLYQSTLVTKRPTKPGEGPLEHREGAASSTTVCGFCHKVYANFRWISPREYYLGGGVSNVRLDHRVCPTCASNFAAL